LRPESPHEGDIFFKSVRAEGKSGPAEGADPSGTHFDWENDNVALMKKDPDLDALRDRADFQRLLAEREAAGARKLDAMNRASRHSKVGQVLFPTEAGFASSPSRRPNRPEPTH
jgi:hypothetical protein